MVKFNITLHRKSTYLNYQMGSPRRGRLDGVA